MNIINLSLLKGIFLRTDSLNYELTMMTLKGETFAGLIQDTEIVGFLFSH